LSDDFTGTTAVVMAYDDPVGPAKALADFAKDHEKFILRSAVLEGEKLGPKELESLAKLPSKEVLLGQLLTVLNGVPQGLVQVLSAVPRNFGYGLQALKDQKEQLDN
ncbi:MAG: 50S ribosomal protein L10, partial [Desulfopila sp.]